MISSDHDLSLDEWQEHLAGTMPVPSSWYSKSDKDKAKWLQKRDRKANRYTHVDDEAAWAERVKIRIYKALNAKRRDQGANSTV
ncbi:hypothetical protein H9P43_002495 [Blastocladiella emersonii ATCC 22665]|nr:hypothetical protein H9P43_002495 [Blastocladiella emersonii ATCC 22665]